MDKYISQLTTAFNEGGFSGLVGEIGDVLADVVSEVVAYTPKIIDAAVSVIESFISGIREAIPTLAPAAVEIGTALIEGIYLILLFRPIAISSESTLTSIVPTIAYLKVNR